MSANTLLNLSVQICFFLLAAAILAEFLQRRDRFWLDVMLAFCSIAVIFLLSDLTADSEIWITRLIGIFLLAQPYLFMRLIRYFRPASYLVYRGALIGMFGAWLLVVIFLPEPPLLVNLLLLGYFVGIELYAVRELILESFASGGVNRRRLILAGSGTGFIAGAVLTLGIGDLLPTYQHITTTIYPIFAICAALAYYAGFATPFWLRHIWQLDQLHTFLYAGGNHLATQDKQEELLHKLCNTALQSVGGSAAAIYLRKAEEMRLEYTTDPAVIPTGQPPEEAVWAWEQQKPLFLKQTNTPDSKKFAADPSIQSLFAVPIAHGAYKHGLLVVLMRSISPFIEEDRQLLTILAEQTALAIENQALVAHLERQIEARTEALRASEAELRAIFMAMKDLIVVLDAEGTYLRIAPTDPPRRYRPQDAVLGKRLHEIFDAEQADIYLSCIQQALITQKTVNIEYQLGSGEQAIWFSASISPMASDQVIWVARDITEQKQTAEQFRQLLDTLPTPIIITSITDGRVKYANDSYASITRVPPEGVIGQQVQDSYVNRDERQQIMQALREKGYVRNREIQFKRWDGTIAWSVFSAHPIQFEGEECLVAGFSDITDLKEMQTALQKSEASFRSLFEAAPVAIVIIDTRGKIMVVNAYALEMFGYQQDELIGESLEILLPERLREIHISHRGDYFKEPRARTMGHGLDLAGLRKDGREFPIEVGLSYFDSPDGLLAMSFITDITERKHAAAVQQRLAAIVEFSDDSIIGKTPEGIITSWNTGAERMYGYTAEEAIGQPITIIFPPDKQDEWLQIRQRIQVGEAVQHIETTRISKTGQQLAISLTISPIVNAANEITGYSAIARNITQQKLAEEALLESEKKYRQIVETAQEGIWLIDANSQTTFVNQKLAEMLGYTVEEMIGKPTATFMDAEMRKAAEEKMRRRRTGIAERFEFRYRRKDGSPLWVMLSTSPLFNDNGQFIGALAMASDITERRGIEAALRESEEKYRQIVETAQEGIWLIDVYSQTTFVNQKMAEMLGYTVDEMMGESLFSFMDAEIEAVIGDGIDHYQSTTEQNELRFIRKDGSHLWGLLSANPLTDKRGRYLGALAMVADITERKQAETRLHLLLDLTRAIGEARDFDLAIEIVLKLICERTAWTLGEAWIPDRDNNMLQPGSIYYTTSDQPELENFRLQQSAYPLDNETGLLGRIWQSRMPEWWQDISDMVDVDFLGVNHARTLGFKAALGVPIISSDQILAILIFYMKHFHQEDISFIELVTVAGTQLGAVLQQKLIQQELAQLTQELIRSNTELQQFAYVASHDLQEPLRMVTSYLQLLERRYKNQLDSDAEEFINFAVDGAARMKRLINDLLLFSRVGTHGKAFSLVDCKDLLAGVLDNLKSQIQENDAVITHDPLPTVYGDETQIMQLFQNLISNGIKFRQQTAPEIHIGVERQGNYWLFSVCDNGIGIEEQYEDRIFVIFQRLHSRTEYEGTGIGLAICKKIVERHGGKIWMTSQPGKGSIFYFTLHA